MNQNRLARWIFIGAIPATVGLFWLTAGAHFKYTPDDTYIYLQFARNILHGGGISFNPGEPTYGFTSPFWLGVITIAGKLGAETLVAAKSIDLLFAGLTIIVVYLLAFEIIRDSAVALLAMMVCSLNIWLLRWAGTGLETSLAVFTVMVALLFALRNRYVLSILACGIGTLVRPEIFFLAPLILIDLAINSRERGDLIALILRLVGLYLLIVVPWLIIAYTTFGTIVPNTALAKGGFHFTLDEVSSTSYDILRTVAFSDGISGLILVIAFVVLLSQLRKSGAGEAIDGFEKFVVFRQSLIGIGWIVTIPLIYIIGGVNVVSRYLLMILPLVVIYAFWYLDKCLIFSRISRFRYTVIFFVTALLMLQSQLLYRRYALPGIAAFQQGMEMSLIPIGFWLNRNTPADAVVFAPDVGAVGYYSERKICDAAGLVSPTLLSYVRRGYTNEMMIEDRIFSSACQAQYVVDRSFTPERWKDRPDLLPLMTRTFYQMGIGDSRINYYTVYKVVPMSK